MISSHLTHALKHIELDSNRCLGIHLWEKAQKAYSEITENKIHEGGPILVSLFLFNMHQSENPHSQCAFLNEKADKQRFSQEKCCFFQSQLQHHKPPSLTLPEKHKVKIIKKESSQPHLPINIADLTHCAKLICKLEQVL